MKHRYCDISQDVLLRLLRFPEGTKIVRMDVVHDSKVVGPAPLRLMLEIDESYDVYPGTETTSISPWYWEGPIVQFARWWDGYSPPLGHFSFNKKQESECT